MKHKSIINGWFLSIIAGCLYLASCVPARQFEDLQKKDKECQDENSRMKSDNQQLTTKNTELRAEIEELQKRIANLEKDTSELGSANRRLTGLYNELMKS